MGLRLILNGIEGKRVSFTFLLSALCFIFKLFEFLVMFIPRYVCISIFVCCLI